MASMGRPTKLSRAVHDQIVKTLTAGNYLETAAALAGVDVETVRRWITRGAAERKRIADGGDPDKAEAPFVEFCGAVKTARATAEADALAVVRKGGQGWQASAWFLERTNQRFRVNGEGFNEDRATEPDRSITWVLRKPDPPPPAEPPKAPPAEPPR